jgi:hypothetical protein
MSASPLPASGLSAFRRRQNFFCCPAELDAVQDYMATPSHFFGPSRNALSAPFMGQQSVVSAIPRVLFCGHPAKIAWLVVSISINAIKLVSVAWRVSNLCANVCRKFFVFRPGGIHRDPSPPIGLKGIVITIKAASPGVYPGRVQASANLSVLRTDSSSPSIRHSGSGGLRL